MDTRRTALALLIPAADPIVDPWRQRYDPHAAAGVPAHVTVLYPWIPADRVTEDDLAAVAELVGRRPALRLTFAALGRFPTGLWLAPDPVEPVRELTDAVVARWPAYPPYGGRFDVVQPHLTIVDGTDPATLAHVVDDVEPKLPLTVDVDALHLVEQTDDGRWRVREAFGFQKTV